jgi:drug/metabolite transporter (DMT)-like permease
MLFLGLFVAICLPILCSFFGAALGFHNPLFACLLVFLCCFSAILLLFCWYWDQRKIAK